MALFTLLAQTRLRIAEALALTWDDVKIRGRSGSVTVRKEKQEADGAADGHGAHRLPCVARGDRRRRRQGPNAAAHIVLAMHSTAPSVIFGQRDVCDGEDVGIQGAT